MTAPAVLFLGESPPRNAPPDFAPFDCRSGDNLARALGLKSRAEVLAHLPRANVFDAPTGIGDGTPKWDDTSARINAMARVINRGPRVVVALGRRPCDAMGCDDLPPMTLARVGHPNRPLDVLHIPHPSGRSTSLNSDLKKREARQAMLPEVVMGCPTLRPWHFDLEDHDVLADLGAALSPLRPALGVAACLLAAEAHSVAHTNTGRARLALMDIPTLQGLAAALAVGPGAVVRSWSDAVPVSGLTSRERHVAKSLDPLLAYPPAVLRAAYGRHVAWGLL